MPVPFNLPLLKTALWLKCTDQSPNHQNDAFYWYYWDPSRKECDQKQGPHYQIASFTVKEANSLERQSYPDYAKLIRSVGVDKTMKMTFAFGHITKPEVSDPFTDTDYNIQTFRKFIEQMRVTAKILNLKETPILQSEYMDAPRPEQQIGARFLGMKNGVQVEIKVVASGDIEPIQLFAQSYAHHHDGFFAWFGHSQVGSEWEAQQFENLVLDYPEYYSLSKDYQIIYWAGCTSYTYYTSRFFKMKAALDPENDPNGTKALDIVSNGFSTQFLPYYLNAMTWFGSLINWEMQTSYQAIVDDLEQASTAAGRVVLVNVLGDEDNPKTAEY